MVSHSQITIDSFTKQGVMPCFNFIIMAIIEKWVKSNWTRPVPTDATTDFKFQYSETPVVFFATNTSGTTSEVSLSTTTNLGQLESTIYEIYTGYTQKGELVQGVNCAERNNAKFEQMPIDSLCVVVGNKDNNQRLFDTTKSVLGTRQLQSIDNYNCYLYCCTVAQTYNSLGLVENQTLYLLVATTDKVYDLIFTQEMLDAQTGILKDLTIIPVELKILF